MPQVAPSIPCLAFAAALCLAQGLDSATVGEEQRTLPPEAFDARAAEHLLSRAGFGARTAEVDRAVEQGLEATLDRLFAPEEGREPFFVEPPEKPTRAEKKHLTVLERGELRARIAREDRELLQGFADWWVAEMLGGSNALREHMTLFWHGHFTSSQREVQDAVALIRQNEVFREHALGNFGELLRAVLRDSAMLAYLDNDQNTLRDPNENLARELFELFTLGEGHYTERDVQEAARALTGWVVRYPVGAEFVRGRHDGGEKQVLGTRARLDADGLADLILAQPACAPWVAGRIVAYFEGREVDERRRARYGDLLREHAYELEPLLRALFADPEFYSEEVVGARISGPIEYLVGVSRRLDLEPPPRLVWVAAGQLGQRLFEPPSVKGWDGGKAWIGTSSLLQRGNVAGLLLGIVSLEQVLAREPSLEDAIGGDDGMDEAAMDDSMDDAMAMQPRPEDEEESGGLRRALEGGFYVPRLHLAAGCGNAGAERDREIVDYLCRELLAVEVGGETRAALEGLLAAERAELGARDGDLLEQEPEGEHALRRLAHVVLSLPEAHLH
jgi:uncharacterized protein (DUF1800 family)